MSKITESCVETTAAPEWLSKLESRREKLTRAKLGHEAGAGAPCNECRDKCPGLDLHFWRKVCRNCKCRKDQHCCIDDDLSGWAQFEILGQIRSKPAYIKIKALAEQPVKVDWVPPNATLDVVSEYMSKLGSKHIPVAGSDAAAKRKQQLEFQVPPHDLDATLCDNLSESEAVQLKQYVEKIRENCVGQGNVIRIGNESALNIMKNQINNQIKEEPMFGLKHSTEIFRILNVQQPASIVNDKILMQILKSEKLTSALMSVGSSPLLFAFSKQLHDQLSPIHTNYPNNKIENFNTNEMNLNSESIKSLIENGPVYDEIISKLKSKGIDFSKDPVLHPISEFRQKYLNDDAFKSNVENFLKLSSATPYSTPIKSKGGMNFDVLNSPLPVKPPICPKTGVMMKQDTPIRKVKFGGVNVAYLLGLSTDANIEKDKILHMIASSEPIQKIFEQTSKKLPSDMNLILNEPLLMRKSGEFDYCGLSMPVLSKIKTMGCLNKYAIQSVVLNGPFYDRLLSNLKARGCNYSNCPVLDSIEKFREEFTHDMNFQKEIVAFVENMPNNYSIALSEQVMSNDNFYPANNNQEGYILNVQNSFKSNIHGSKSTDSGFESKPPTPNYAAYPGGTSLSSDTTEQLNNMTDSLQLKGIDAFKGKFSSIPGIEEMNMYPNVETSSLLPLDSISDNLSNLNLFQSIESAADNNCAGSRKIHQNQNLVATVLKCKDCSKDVMLGDVAVTAERAGKEFTWHPECFKCHKCRELLADLVYFYHNGNVYCGRDLAIILKIPRCNACDELIFTKNYTMAEGSTFHIKHFCCYQCDIPLAGQQYVPDEKTNMPLCLNCYNKYYAELCQYCKNIIGPTEQGVAWGKIHWHGNCFNCHGKGCGKSLLGGRFCVRNNLPFCSSQCVKTVIF